ncbi:MAG TPA: CorA family divalent cation transporter, partial [Propionicimonas sp.]
MPRTRLYREGVLVSEGFPVAEISDRIAEPSTLVWFDVCDPTSEDLEAISEELGLHHLAVEDAIHEHQRPKLDRYSSHLFVTAYTTSLDVVSGELTQHKVSAFITHNALVTVRAGDDIDVAELTARWDRSADLAKYGVAFLIHGLLDYVVDSHFETVQALDTEMEGLEDEVF